MQRFVILDILYSEVEEMPSKREINEPYLKQRIPPDVLK